MDEAKTRVLADATNPPRAWTGLALTLAAVGASWLVAARNAPGPQNRPAQKRLERLRKPGFEPPPPVFAVVWPLTGKAARVDAPAAGMSLPHSGWVSFAALLAEELWRRNRDRDEDGLKRS